MNGETFHKIWESGIYIEQRLPEFRWLVNEVEKLNPHLILEIGVMKGGSLKFWEQLVEPRDLVIGVDINPETPDIIEWDWKNSDRVIKIIIGDSQDKETIKQVKEALIEMKVDFLFIDGDHGCAPRYNPYVRLPCHDINNIPRRDFENYTPFVRSGGLVCIADLGEPCCNDTYEALTGRKKKLVGQDGHGLWWKP